MKLIPILTTTLLLLFVNTNFASGLSSIGSSISNNANNQLINAINQPIPFVVSDWAMLSSYYSQNSSFAPAGLYAVDVSVLSGVNSITNTAFGTLEIRYGSNAPGPMAGKGYALAPTRVSSKGNVFYVYELVQCFTNIIDSPLGLNTPKEGSPSSVFGNSNLGTNCSFSLDPYSAAVSEVNGTSTNPAATNQANVAGGSA